MSGESMFRIAFWVLFGGMIARQIYFASRVHQAGAPSSARAGGTSSRELLPAWPCWPSLFCMQSARCG